jgi:protein dithiol oxidoreductase (disulfide-forming)
MIVIRWLAVALCCAFASLASAAELAAPWQEGVHYFSVAEPKPTGLPKGKVEVVEVFSYGCPACARFAPAMRRLVKELPKNAVVRYLHADWLEAENWPTFQRAYVAAESLGVAAKADGALYDAIWRTGELAVFDFKTRRPKYFLPTLEEIGNFYERTTGMKSAQFLSAAKSAPIDDAIKITNERIIALQADRTPTLVVNGKYRTHPEAAGGDEQIIQLVQWLVAKESPPAKRSSKKS